MPRCPNGHESDAADFCSVCGAEMVGMVTAPLPVPAVCPVCTTPRDSMAQAVCEVCGYNFRTGGSGIPRPAPPAPTAGARCDVVLEGDANLYGKPSPEAPVGHPVHDGDVLAVGAWTKITVREVRPPAP